MIDNKLRTGSCLCGAVKFKTPMRHVDLGACHCHKCQKWAGGPLFEVECGAEVLFEGDEHIKVFNSSDIAQRGFCQICGSHLFVRDRQSGDVGIPPGLFEDATGIEFRREVFSDQKPAYYQFANHTVGIDSETIYRRFPQVKKA